jgi:hypothetical protein
MTAPASPRLPLPGLTDLLARQREQLAAELEEMRVALLAKHHPDVAHAWLDADPDTAYPLPGVAHPKTTTEVTA